MTLCARCQQFDIQSFSKGIFSRTYDLSDAAKADAAGCPFCGLLLESLQAPWNRFILARKTPRIKNWLVPMRIHLWVTRVEPGMINSPGLGIIYLNAGIGRRWSNLGQLGGEPASLHVAADSGTCALSSGDIVGEIHSEVTPWSSARFDRIKAWHANCRLNHIDCNQTMNRTQKIDCEDVPLPTRYLEIMTSNKHTQNQSALQFVLREAVGRRGRYIALSHRWTEACKNAMTTKENYICRTGACSQHSPCSPWDGEALSELFRQACSLAVHLGITNIWIDSVCIIQDDLNDWKMESVKMADYYQFSWLTIVATQTTPSGGLSSDLAAMDIPRLVQLPYLDREGQQQGYFYLQRVDRQALISDFMERVSNCELMKRGWVFQERALSRRTLTFSGASWGIFMRCQNGDAPRAVTGDQIYPDEMSTFVPFSFVSDMAIFCAWRLAVESYSGLQLTRIDEDRLVALAGFATEFGKALKALNSANLSQGATQIVTNTYTYSSGSWLDDSSSLLWQQTEAQVCTRIRGIPTWSWASIRASNTTSGDEEGQKGASVQWPNPGYQAEKLGRIERAVALPLDEATWSPTYTGTLQSRAETSYGNESRFSILYMRGKLLCINIDGHFAPDHANVAAKATDHRNMEVVGNWQRVATHSTPDMVAGWGSVEHPEYHDESACRSAQDIVAFPLKKSTSSKSMAGLGNIFKRHVIFHVLYLRPIENPVYAPCYERIGVGRLFELEVSKLFEAADEQGLWLV